jgi:hypothetical protein
VEEFVSKLRVYSISDQDDAGPWARAEFPKLFWIASIHAFGEYKLAAWTGINMPIPTSASDMTQQPWLDAHVRKGPLGSLYPKIAFGMEGDTPSFLNLIPNGLVSPEHPDWGGWGGRYGQVSQSLGLWADVIDTVPVPNGKPVASNQATIWRWRSAYQNDLAARIAWSISPTFREANHNPELVLNGVPGWNPVVISVCPKDTIHLSASGSGDPDGDHLTYHWWHYRDVDAGLVPFVVNIEGADSIEATIKVPTPMPPIRGLEFSHVFHVILEVTDDGSPQLTSYRRAIIQISNKNSNGVPCPK